MSDLVDVDADFAAPPLHEVVAERLVRGESRDDVARALGLELGAVHEAVARTARDRRRAAGSRAERLAVLGLRVEDITRRAYRELDRDEDAPVALLGVLIEAMRLELSLEQRRRP